MRVQAGDVLVAIDGRLCDPDTLYEDLVGEDVVGSPVCLRIKRISTGRHVEVNVIRGSVARIQAIGELFLMFTELLADISKNQRISADEIFRIENQAKIANDFSTTYLEAFREHIHDLEQALINAASRPGVGKQGENEDVAKLRQELKQLQQRASSLEESIKTKDAAHKRELDEAKTMAISGSTQQEMAMAKLQLELADAEKKISDLEAQRQASEQSLRTAETRLRTTAGTSTEMQSRLEESRRKMDDYALSLAAAEQLLQQKLKEISKLSSTVRSFSERSLRKWIMSGLAKGFDSWRTTARHKSSMKRVVAKVIGQWCNQTIWACFRGWYDNTARLAHVRLTGNKVVLRMQKLALATAFESWHHGSKEKERVKRAALKVLKRWDMMALSVPFQSWADSVTQQQRLKRAAQRVVGRWNQLSMSVPFSTWHDNVSEKKRLQRAASKVLKRWEMMALSVPFQSWAQD